MVAFGKSILIVEDEADFAHTVSFNLSKEGYRCQIAPDGSTALAEIAREPPDLILLDRMLPGTSGDDVMTELQRDSQLAGIPVIMLTAKGEETDQLVGFALGATDYIAKPCSMKLLIARVAAALRHTEDGTKATTVLTCGPITLDAGQHRVTVNGNMISLTLTEFGILRELMVADGCFRTRDQLINAAHGSHVAVTDRAIDVHITSIRRKLGEAAGCIRTIRGVGYAMREG
jgi:two-component system phosphate regulon response regulator PhoB